jgi:hypothetical protein
MVYYCRQITDQARNFLGNLSTRRDTDIHARYLFSLSPRPEGHESIEAQGWVVLYHPALKLKGRQRDMAIPELRVTIMAFQAAAPAALDGLTKNST